MLPYSLVTFEFFLIVNYNMFVITTHMYIHICMTFIYIKTRISQNNTCFEKCILDFSILFSTLWFRLKIATWEHLTWFHNSDYENNAKNYTAQTRINLQNTWDHEKDILLLLTVMTVNICWANTICQTLGSVPSYLWQDAHGKSFSFILTEASQVLNNKTDAKQMAHTLKKSTNPPKRPNDS